MEMSHRQIEDLVPALMAFDKCQGVLEQPLQRPMSAPERPLVWLNGALAVYIQDA